MTGDPLPRLNRSWAGEWRSFNNSSPVEVGGERMGWTPDGSLVMDGAILRGRPGLSVSGGAHWRSYALTAAAVVVALVVGILVGTAASTRDIGREAPAGTWSPAGPSVDLDAPTDPRAISKPAAPTKSRRK